MRRAKAKLHTYLSQSEVRAMLPLTVNVTRHDLDTCLPRNDGHWTEVCPIARATRRKLPKGAFVSVGLSSVLIGSVQFRLPEDALELRRSVDWSHDPADRKQLKPLRFTITEEYERK